jgi:hypothetical protein
MITARDDLLLIPFGTASFHPEKVELAGFSPDGLRLWSASPCVLINRALRTPLRLNSGPLPVATPSLREVAADVEGEIRSLQSHLERLCGEWTRPPRRVLQRYFDEVQLEIERNRATLEERAAPFAGLYEAAHWTFSALLPLPRAHLHLPAPGARTSLDAADIVRVDFAFWTGAGLVAVVPAGQRTPTPAERRDRERLEAWGIDLRPYDPNHFAGTADGGLLTFLGPAFTDFWKTEPLPSGMQKGAGLGWPLAAPS